GLQLTMRESAKAVLTLAAAAILLGGCNESAKNSVKARPNAPVPSPKTQQAEQFPFPPYEPSLAYYLIDRRPRVEILVAKMQASFEAGQKAFEAGKLDVARDNFNQAVSEVLASGV